MASATQALDGACTACGERRPRLTDSSRPLWLWCGALWCRFLKLSGSDFTERHQAALRLVPQHKPYAPKALQERYLTDLAQFGMVAQHAR